MSNISNFLDVEIERGDFAVLLEECRKKKEFTDVQLQVGDKLFDAHRNILSLYSPVLKAMISDQEWSKEEMKMMMKAIFTEQWSMTKICPISDEFVDPEIMEDLLSFLYTGKIKLTPDNVLPICVATHYLQIPSLLGASVKYLCQLLNTENVLQLFEFSTAHELEVLSHSCLRIVSNNQISIFNSSKILEFSANDLTNMIVGLKKFRAEKLRENTFHCIVRWTRRNISERWGELPVLLKSIPLEELPFGFLSQTVSNHSLVQGSISGIEAVSDALDNQQTYLNTLSQTNQNLVVLSVKTQVDKGYVPSISCFDSQTGLWRDLPAMPIFKSHFGVTVFNQKDIIVCGGTEGGSEFGTKTKSVDKFDWATQTWEKLPDMPMTLRGVSIAVIKNHLYAAGGVMGRSRDSTTTFLCYSFGTKRWKKFPPMNYPRTVCRLLEYKNQLYAIGGGTNTVERYSPAQDTWTMMASMKNNRSIIATLHQDKIYVFGDEGFEEYNPAANVWKSLPEPPIDFGHYSIDISLVSMNGKLLILGGYLKRDSRNLSMSHCEPLKANDSIYEFEFSTQKWIEFGKMDPGRVGRKHSAVVGTFNSAAV